MLNLLYRYLDVIAAASKARYLCESSEFEESGVFWEVKITWEISLCDTVYLWIHCLYYLYRTVINKCMKIKILYYKRIANNIIVKHFYKNYYLGMQDWWLASHSSYYLLLSLFHAIWNWPVWVLTKTIFFITFL